jgi:hypothetical protein
LTLAAKLLGAVVAVVQGFTSIRLDWPAAPIAAKLLGVVALAIVCFHLANTRTRVELGHWKVERLRRVLRHEVMVGWGFPAAILFLVVFCPATWVTLLLIGAIFLTAEMLYEPIEEEIRQIVEEDPHLSQGTSRFANRRPFKFMGIDRTIGQMASGMHRPGLQRFLGFWVKPPWWPSLSRTRTVIIYAMLISCFVAFSAAADDGLQKLVVPDPPPAKVAGDGSQADGPGEAAVAATSASPGQGSGASAEDERPCPHLPAFGAPAWARSDLNALYYGTKKLNATPPPGRIGGCTSRAIVPTAEHGTFVYTIGRNALGEIRSVAVDSLEFGPAIFLAPAAQRVLALLRRGLAPLGGYPIMEVVGGDAVAITSERGTFALVRRSKHLPDSALATPYVELSPTAATAWAGAMHERGGWLWPLSPMDAGGLKEYPLTVYSDSTRAIAAVTYDPGDGTAQRDQYSYHLPEPQIGQYELEAYARTAR